MILLVGAARTGKDTIGAYLKQHHGYARASFAKPLYNAIGPLYGIDTFELMGDKEATIERRQRSVRDLVQDLGDHVRTVCGPRILIDRLVERTRAAGDWQTGHPLVITDGRTEAEVDWVRAQGGRIWWVRSDNAQLVRPHGTERVEGLRLKVHQPDDATITNNGTIEALYVQVDRALFVMRNPVAA